MTVRHTWGSDVWDSISDDFIGSCFLTCGIFNDTDGSVDTLIKECIPWPSEDGGGGESDSKENPFTDFKDEVGDLAYFRELEEL